MTLLISQLVASIPAFALYKIFVFKAKGHLIKDFVRFQSVYIVPVSLNIFALPFLVWLGLTAIAAQAIITSINVVLNYIGHTYFSLDASRNKSPINSKTTTLLFQTPINDLTQL